MARRTILLDQLKRLSRSAPENDEASFLERFSLWLWLADVCILMAVWLVLVGSVSRSELLAACVAAVFVASVTEFIRRTGFARFYPRPRWLLYLRNLPVEVLSGCGILGEILFSRVFRRRQEHGFFQMERFPAGGRDARSAARRASSIIVTTIAPHTLVVDIERRRHFILLHQFRTAATPSFISRVRDE